LGKNGSTPLEKIGPYAYGANQTENRRKQLNYQSVIIWYRAVVAESWLPTADDTSIIF